MQSVHSRCTVGAQSVCSQATFSAYSVYSRCATSLQSVCSQCCVGAQSLTVSVQSVRSPCTSSAQSLCSLCAVFVPVSTVSQQSVCSCLCTPSAQSGCNHCAVSVQYAVCSLCPSLYALRMKFGCAYSQCTVGPPMCHSLCSHSAAVVQSLSVTIRYCVARYSNR